MNKIDNNIVKFLLSQNLSLFGSALVEFAIIWHITLTTKSGMMMTVATLCTFLPRLVVSFFSGVIVDKYERKKLIIISDGFIALVTLLLAICYISGVQSIYLIFMALSLRSVGSGIQTPAINSFITQIVRRDDLLKINGLNGSMQSLITLLAPAISGVLLSITSISIIFFIDVITALSAIIIMNFIKSAPFESSLRNNYLEDLKEGVNYVKRSPLIKKTLYTLAIYYLLITPAALLCQLIIARNFGEDVWRLTINEVFFSVGSMIGGLLIHRIGKMYSDNNILIYSCILIGILNITLGFSSFIIFLSIMFFLGLFMSFFAATQMSLIQKSVSSQMQGRVFGFVQIVINAGFPIGMIVFGPLGDYVDLKYIFSFAGIGLCILGYKLKLVNKPENFS